MNLEKTIFELGGFVSNDVFNDPIALNFSRFKDELKFCKRIEFLGCTFRNYFQIDSLLMEEVILSFTDCTFSEYYPLSWTGMNINSLNLKRCEISSLIIQDSKIDYLQVSDCKIQELNLIILRGNGIFVRNKGHKSLISKVLFSNVAYEDTSIESVSKIETLTIYKTNTLFVEAPFGEVKLQSGDFKSLTFSGNPQLPKFTIDSFKCYSQNFNGDVLFEDIICNEFVLSDVSSQERLKFFDVQFNQCTLLDLNIDRLYLHNVQFNCNPCIERCDLSGMKSALITWEKGKFLKNTMLKEPIFAHRYIDRISSQERQDMKEAISIERDTYRQFKIAALNNHDQQDALEFYRLEMRLLWKEYQLGGKPIKDGLIIFVNRWSSDFNQNWLLPLIWLFLFHTLWFVCILGWFWNNQFAGCYEMEEYFNLLLPTHKTPEYINTGPGALTVLVMRISSGFFIYQFIRATRKFNKSL